MNESAIRQPNSEFERKEELNKALGATLSEKDQLVLKECTTQDYESIALIGCLLKDDSLVNLARLMIGTKNRSNRELANKAEDRLTSYDQEALIDKIASEFISNTDNISEIEDKIYYALFDVLS